MIQRPGIHVYIDVYKLHNGSSPMQHHNLEARIGHEGAFRVNGPPLAHTIIYNNIFIIQFEFNNKNLPARVGFGNVRWWGNPNNPNNQMVTCDGDGDGDGDGSMCCCNTLLWSADRDGGGGK